MTEETKKRKVAIVARAPSSRYLYPKTDDWEIWTLSPMQVEGYTDLPRWDRWYELHQAEEMSQQMEKYSINYIQWLKALPEGKLWTIDNYPIEDVVKELGTDYGTSSVSWMICHAIYERVDTLGIFGCDMAHITEYASQRPAVEYWIGYARGRGIEVILPSTCDVVKHRRRYGFDKVPPSEAAMGAREKELAGRFRERQEQIDHNLRITASMVGSMSEIDQVLNQLNGEMTDQLAGWVEKRKRDFKANIEQAQREYEKLRTERDQLSGALEENRYQRQWV